METDHEHSWRRIVPNLWACRTCFDVATDARAADETATPTSGSMGRPPNARRSAAGELVRAGHERAKAYGTRSGKPIGRPRANVDVQAVLQSAARADCPTVKAQARTLGVGRTTLYRRMEASGYRWVPGGGWVSDGENGGPASG